MQSVSELWSTLRALPGTEVEWRFDIEGVTYGKENEVSHSANLSLFTEFGFGNTGCGGLNLQLYADSIPKGAEIKRFCRLINGDQVSEWLAMGVYYTNLRSEEDGFWEIEAFDNMRKAEKVWEPDQSLEFPMPMDEAVAEICRVLGFTLDSRTTISHDYSLDYPQSEQTFRQTLNWIAAAHGGNFIFTGEGKLRLVPLVSIPLEADGAEHQIGQDLFSAKNNGKRKPVSRVTLFADAEYVYTAGNDDGMELVADCAYATQAMVDNLLSVCKGFSYQAFEAEGANLDPAAELGDGVLADGMYSIFARIAEDGSGYPNISAPGDLEREEEYPEGGFWEQRFNRKLAQTRSLISKTTEELLLMVEGFDGRISQLSVDVDSISGEVQGLEEDYAAFRLTVEGFWVDGPNGSTLIAGNLIDTSTLNVDNINIDISGRISFEDLTDYETVQGDIDAAYDLAAEAWDMADSVQLPDYITKTCIDHARIVSPTIEANDIGLYGGYFDIYDSSGTTHYGSLGYGSGLTTAGDVTRGVVMSADGNTDLGEEGNYFIATNAGTRMQSGGSKVFAVDGMAVMESHGNQIYVGASGAYIKVNGVISPINGSSGGDGGGGDMTKAVYDPDGEVAAAGGIAAFVRAVHGGGSGGDTLPSKDTWEGVIARMDNGTYATEYAIGDTVPLDLGSEGVINMQIAAFDADDMPYNQGKAKISWVAKELLATKHRMNPTYVSQTYGTGAVGGWKYCEMRTYLNDTIKPLIAESVASRIVAVTKHRNSHDGFGYEHQGIEDELWIPSTFEVAGVANNQYNGLVDHKYQALFPDAASRKKKQVSGADYINWWASDISTAQYFNFFASSGAYSMADANSKYGVCLGFCTN